MKYTLPKLDYEYSALEPFIDTKTMEIHHSKHHLAYINNLNAALEGHNLINSLEEMLTEPNLVPSDISTAVQNNGGGHYNHSFFWELLKVNHGGKTTGSLLKAINTTFGSFDGFKDQFTKAALTRFGSGWAWLIVNKNKELEIISTPNQNSCLPFGKPVIGLDVWEHAYYLNYQNRRADYISSFFSIIDWKQAKDNYEKAL